jgi:hypothetical protein
MAQRYGTAVRGSLGRVVALLSHDPAQTGLLAGVALAGLVVIGLWGLYGDLFFSNMAVVAVSEVLIVCYAGSLIVLAGRLVRSQDRWQVESALTLRELLSEGKDGAANVQAGSPFYARQLRLRLEDEILRCREYGTSVSVVAARLELPDQRPSRAGFSQASFDVAELVTSHRQALLAPTALGMFEYAFLLPNCERRSAKAMATFVANELRRYRCSFGVAVFPDDGRDADALLRCAVEQCGMLHSSAA